MKKSRLLDMCCTCVLAFFITSANAVMVFDIDFVSGFGSGQTATGTSDGIGWSLSPTHITSGLTVTNGTFTGFNTSNHVPPIPATDVLHISAEDFVLTFDQPITSALFYVGENLSASASLDFGITPTFVSGDIEIVGTRFRPTTQTGGVVRLDGINTTTLSHTSIIFNSLNTAFYVNAVPIPPAVWLFGSGLLGLVGIARRKKAA